MSNSNGAPADAFTREETYAATRRPVDLAQTLTPEAYRSDAFFEVERERVFGKSWVAVGCSAQVRQPGDVLVAETAVGVAAGYGVEAEVRKRLAFLGGSMRVDTLRVETTAATLTAAGTLSLGPRRADSLQVVTHALAERVVALAAAEEARDREELRVEVHRVVGPRRRIDVARFRRVHGRANGGDLDEAELRRRGDE